MQPKPSIRESMALGVLALSPVPMAAHEVARNFDVDQNRVASIYKELDDKGYVTELEGRRYELTPDGEERVEIRGD